MAIKIRPAGEPTAIAKAGAVVGASEKAKREQEIALRQAAEDRARQWELEKMQMRSQQGFQQELRMKQAQLDKEARAEEWVLEKAEIRSRLDFEAEEKERQRKIDGINNALTTLDKAVESNRYTPEQVAPLRTKYEMELEAAKAGTPMTVPISGLRKQKPERPPSARQQVSEIEAGFELEGYTPEDLIELGLDPADFPDIGGVTEEGLPSPTTQAEYDAIPSGSDYIDSSGNIRTKR